MDVDAIVMGGGDVFQYMERKRQEIEERRVEVIVQDIRRDFFKYIERKQLEREERKALEEKAVENYIKNMQCQDVGLRRRRSCCK